MHMRLKMSDCFVGRSRRDSHTGLVTAFVVGIAWLGAILAADEALARQVENIASRSVQPSHARSLRISAATGCALPRRSAVRPRGGTYTVTLANGDIGRCPTDAQRRHNAPYWERAMIYARPLQKRGQKVRISGEFRFDKDFESATRTTFFQIHQANGRKCNCWPLVMIRMSYYGILFVEAPSLRGSPARIRIPGWDREDFEMQWVEVAVDVSTAPGRQLMKIYLAGREVWRGHTMIRRNGQFQPQFGLYRPGSRSGNPTDRIHIRNLRYSTIQ